MQVDVKKERVRALSTLALRRALVFVSALCLAVVLLGSGLNHLGHKWTRVSGTGKTVQQELIMAEVERSADSLLAQTGTGGNGKEEGGVCKRQVLATNVPDSVMCCDMAQRRGDWVCVAAFDRFNKILSSTWAYVIPLVPWALSAALDSSSSTAHARRLLLYGVVFFVRTFLLYKGLGWLQSSLQPAVGADCWYAAFARSNKCLSDNFDFSDHIVLYVANYLVPAAVELSYAYTTVVTVGGTMQWLRYVPVACAALAMSLVTLRGVLFTTMFFHTPLESLVGLAVVLVSVVLPIYFLAVTNFWAAAVSQKSTLVSPTASA